MNTLKRKLTIKSRTIANLTGDELMKVKGGGDITEGCIDQNTKGATCYTNYIGCVPHTEQESCHYETCGDLCDNGESEVGYCETYVVNENC